MNKNKYYNLIFPIWLLWVISPVMWVLCGVGNWIIDKLVLKIMFKRLNVENIKPTLKKCMIKVYLLGFLADFVGSVFILLTHGLFSFDDEIYRVISHAVYWNPFTNIFGFMYLCIGVLVSGLCIYIFNVNWSFNKTDLTVTQKRKIALALAIFTAPYFFLFPTSMLYYF